MRARECSFLLITWMDRNLEETRVPMQVIEERVPRQSLQHLINKGKGEMIFPGGLIQFAIINPHAPPGNSPRGDKLVALILNDGHTTLFWNHLDWAHPFTIGDRIDDPCVKEFDNLFLNNLLHIRI